MQEDPFIFKVLAVTALLSTSAFIFLFRKESWSSTEFGRSLMSMAVGVWAFALVATLRQILGPDYPGREQVRIGAYVLIDYAVIARVRTLWKLQRAKGATPPRRRSTDLP